MIYSYVYYAYAVSVQLQTSAIKACFLIAECRFNFCKGRKNLGIMQVHFGSFVCFPYFLCYNTALCS